MRLRSWCLGVVITTATAACHGGSGTSTAATDGPTSDSTSSGSTSSDSTSTGETETTGGPLAACHALPAAEIAQWVEGPSVEPSGASTPARIAGAGARTWELALDLLRVADPALHPSIAASPTSMTIALGLSYDRFEEGPCGDEIHARMHFAEVGDDLHQTLGASILALDDAALPAGPEGEDPVVVGLRPSIWQLQGELASNPIYGAVGHQVSKAAPGALAAIREVMNCVIETQSEGLLVDFVPETHPAGDTEAYDVNVAYLQAPWSVALRKRGDLDFAAPGGVVSRPAIGDSSRWAGHFADDTLTMVEVDLRGDRLAALLVLPDADAYPDLAAFTDALTPAALAGARDQIAQSYVDFTLPSFTIESVTVDYYDPLGFMCPLFTLRSILHGATVQVDEKGIKAAAATMAEEWSTSSGPPPPEFIVTFDRPFLFFIHDRTTGFVLYSGRYAG